MARKKGTFEKISSKARRLGQQMKKGEIKVVPGVKINGLPVVNYQAVLIFIIVPGSCSLGK